MPTCIVITDRARRDLRALDHAEARRILKKLAFFERQDHPLQFAKSLSDARIGMYRFRVGDYRILFDVDRDGTITILLILAVKHRREAYNV